MSQRYRGQSYQTILRKLPRNLLVFDGHCLMCQARVQYVLERNFSHFSFLRLTAGVDAAKLEANKLLFCSFDSTEWRELRRHFSHVASGAEGIVLIEKVPSKTAAFLRRVGRRGGGEEEEEEKNTDILVSHKFTAVCRVGMKLDRPLLRTLFSCLYRLLPTRLGDRWYDRVLMRRRRLWGTSEEDAVRFPRRILGLKERTWKLRGT